MDQEKPGKSRDAQSGNDEACLLNGGTLPQVPWRKLPAVLLSYVVAIATLTWPWLRTFSTHVIDHWDPLFHGWKLRFAAVQILSGNILPPDGNTNMYYPHTGAFYYEALHWPQALFASLLEAAGVNPVATYHVTLVLFWALSGVLFWAFLRAMGLRGLSSFLGGLVFTVMPYRISYAPEFNMQLSFGLPLFLFFAVRFFQRPCAWYAVGAALAWWLQAVSELYQAIFVLFAVPFIAAAFLSRDAALLRSWRRFWRPLTLAVLIGGALSLLFLHPYLSHLKSSTLVRTDDEIMQHCLEPLSLLKPYGHTYLLPPVKARNDEMSVYATVALIIAGLFSAVGAWRRFPGVIRAIRDSSLALFAILAVAVHAGASFGVFASAVYSWLPVVVIVFTVPLLFDRRNDTVRGRMLAALGAAGLLGFFMMLGPRIQDCSAAFRIDNPLFAFFLKHVEGLRGFRVVARFSILPVLWISTVAACGAEALAGMKKRVPAYAALSLLVVLFLAECVHLPMRMRQVRDYSSSTVLGALDERKEPYVLAIVPMGWRTLDSEHMFSVAGVDRLSVYAWGGTYPPLTTALKESLSPNKGDPDAAAALLGQLWPEALVLEDRRPFWRASDIDFARFFGGRAEVVAEDADFRLMRFRPVATQLVESVRLVRRDMLERFPQATFTLQSDSSARVWLDLNGVIVGDWEAGPEPASHSIVIPPELNIRLKPNRFRFHADGDEKFSVTGFLLEEKSAAGVKAEISYATKPWIWNRDEAPAGAEPVHYSDGLSVSDVRFLGFDEEGLLRVGYRLRPPKSFRKAFAVSLSAGVTDSFGKVLFEETVPLLSLIDPAILEAGATTPYYEVEQRIHRPGFSKAGVPYGLSVSVRNSGGRRVSGKEPGGAKVRHLRSADELVF